MKDVVTLEELVSKLKRRYLAILILCFPSLHFAGYNVGSSRASSGK